jgi:hypothetical protein
MISAGGRYFHSFLNCVEELASRPRGGSYGFRIPAGKRNFLFSKTVQFGSAVYSASYAMGTGFFAGGKAAGPEVGHWVSVCCLGKEGADSTSPIPICLQGPVHINL